jgi:ribose-phosphate pyrophosphokinase
MQKLIVVGGVADNPFVEDIAHYLRQHEDYSDLISLKSFLNNEFCPRFIIDEKDWDRIGNKLAGITVLLVSTGIGQFSRDDLAMRNFLIARAAKDNGALRVILLEPDLFYSAQDRGPRVGQGITKYPRDAADYKKFDGQPFSSRLYAELLKVAGVDEVLTVHNHSTSVESTFLDRFSGHFHNLLPADVYADYMRDSDIVNEKNLVLCAPDKGAYSFAQEVKQVMGGGIRLLKMIKERLDEREVTVRVAADSEATLADTEGRDVVVLDDMVRTGITHLECCRLVRTGRPRRIILFVTHFYSNREGRANLNDGVIDEIVTTSTIPDILNRDIQGRLRHKLVVLRISRWISAYIRKMIDPDAEPFSGPLYHEDMSSKNPRWKGKMGPLFSSVD